MKTTLAMLAALAPAAFADKADDAHLRGRSLISSPEPQCGDDERPVSLSAQHICIIHGVDCDADDWHHALYCASADEVSALFQAGQCFFLDKHGNQIPSINADGIMECKNSGRSDTRTASSRFAANRDGHPPERAPRVNSYAVAFHLMKRLVFNLL